MTDAALWLLVALLSAAFLRLLVAFIREAASEPDDGRGD